jgi:FkbH-like protein
MTSFRDVRLDTRPGDPIDAVRDRVAEAVDARAGLWRILAQRAKCIVLQNNADIPAYDEFGNLAGAAPWGRRNAFRLYNVELSNRAGSGVVIVDFDHLSSLFGKGAWVDSRHWFLAKTGFNLDACGLVAGHVARLIAGAKGLAKKCLVLDLDNTLWGGVIGDDGLDGIKLGAGPEGEAFVAFQTFARALNARGIVLAVSSKNDPKNAEEVFEKHPDMRLKLSDIAVFRANWNNKVDNIKEIARVLGLGLDSFVFVDDNPAERAIVRQMLPMVEVPELAEDPADYVASLAGLSLFEATAYSEDDGERARFYRENAKREEFSQTASDLTEYLASLGMRANVGTVDAFSLPRIAQLINKSNQFHLTGTRYSEAEIAALSNDPAYDVLWFRLADRFGDNGLISAVILHRIENELRVDTWVMSCRVLGRSMEEFIGNEILAAARARQCATVVGTYRPSTKNQLVAGLYRKLGFDLAATAPDTTSWRRAVPPDDRPLKTFVERAGSA